jgi:hypothetical protein
MTEALALPAFLSRAGAIMTERGGRAVPAHYGSMTAELAVCSSGVGLAYRADLAVLSVKASPRAIEQILRRMVGASVAPRGVVEEAGAWWCRADSADEVLVICQSAQAARLHVALERATGRFTGGIVADASAASFVLHVIGRRAGAVLADLGVYGTDRDPAGVAPFAEVELAGHRVRWLLAARDGALAVTDVEGAADVWRAVEAVGRGHQMGNVGLEAVDRYVMAGRSGAARNPW